VTYNVLYNIRLLIRHAGWTEAMTADLTYLLDPFSPHELLCLDGELQKFLTEHTAGEALAPIPSDMELLTTLWTSMQEWKESLDKNQ